MEILSYLRNWFANLLTGNFVSESGDSRAREVL